MGTAYRDVVVRIALEQVKAQLEAPDVKPVKQAITDVDKAIAEANANMEESYSDLDAQLAKVEESLKKVAENQIKEAEQAAADYARANDEVTDGLKQVGSGALQAARGVAFLTAANSEQFQQALKVIAVAQGALDVYKGLSAVHEGLTKAKKALAAATAAQAAIEGVATAGTKVGTAATIASTAATMAKTKALAALKIATNPVTIALAGLAALAYSLYREYNKAKTATENLAKAQDQLAKYKKLVRIETRLHAIEAREEAIAQEKAAKASMEARDAIEKARRQALHQLKTPEERMSVRADMAATLKEELAILKEQSRIRDNILNKQIQELDTKKRALEMERNQSRTIEERIGRMTDIQRLELQQLEKRAKEGTISAAGVARAEELVGSSKFSREFFQERGREAGGVGLAETLTGSSRSSTSFGTQLDSVASESEELRREFRQYFENNKANQREVIKTIARESREQLRISEELAQEVSRLRSRQTQLTNARRRVGNRPVGGQ